MLKTAKKFLLCITCIFGITCGITAAHATCGANKIDANGDGNTCEDVKFTVTTTNLNANDTFSFYLSAAGTFYVDCGTDGTLSGTGVSGNTITRASATIETSDEVFTCTYTTGGVKDVKFGGRATLYTSSTNLNAATISFSRDATTKTQVAAVSGSMGAVFPTLGTSYLNQKPLFYGTFQECSNLTTVSANLFSGVTAARTSAFRSLFDKCTNLSYIPNGLFSGITGGAQDMFRSTFYQCTSLTSIPDDLFSSITEASDNMFKYTFSGCTNLSGYIPPTTFAGLIANGHPSATALWSDTFTNTALDTSCPTGTTQYITGYEGDDADLSWNGKVSCYPNIPLTISLNIGAGATAGTPSTIYLLYGEGWYSDSNVTNSISALTTLPTKTTYILDGFYTGQNGSGTKIIDDHGDILPGNLTFTLEPTTLYARWVPYTPCTGSNYFNFTTGTCVSCPGGFTYNTTDGKTRASQCQARCSAGQWINLFTPVEYLQGNGTTTFIDTGYYVQSNNVSVNAVLGPDRNVSNTTNYGNFFGNVYKNANNTVKEGFSGGYKNGVFGFWSDKGNKKAQVTKSFELDKKYTFAGTMNASSISLSMTDTSGTTSGNQSCTNITNSTNPVKLFTNGGTVNNNGTIEAADGNTYYGDKMFPGRIYSFELYDGGTKVLDLIPVRRNLDNELGMLNLVNGEFYTNAGTGTFTTGTVDTNGVFGACVNVGDGYYSSENITNYGSNGTRNQCPDNAVTNKENATSLHDCVGITVYDCDAGEYMPANGNACMACPANSYCSGGEFISTANDQGLTSCLTVGDGSYATSDTGATGDIGCYKACTTEDIANSTAVTGNNYYGAGVDTCEATACDDGYEVSSGVCEVIISYNIIYVMNDGANYDNAPTTYPVGVGATVDGVPTKDGYTFAGWCTDSTLETCAPTQTIANDATGDKTFYAKWTPCTACDATNASCEISVVNNVCTYTTSCNTGYENIQNNGAYNPSCSVATYNISYEMNDGTNYNNAPTEYTYAIGATIDGVPTKAGYIFDGWCTDSTLETCALTQTITINDYGDKTFYAKWTECDTCAATNASCTFDGVSNNTCMYTTACNTGYENIQNDGEYNASCSAKTYTVSYACGTDATGTAPVNATATYDASFTPAANTCTKTGYSFIGWGVDGTNDVKPAGTAFTWNYDSAKTLTAKWTKFAVTTTNLEANDTFTFTMSAKGEFTVDCGADGTLSGTGVSGNTITRTGTGYATYTCTYSTGGVKTISFDGTATEYNSSTYKVWSYGNQYAPIAFYNNTKLVSIFGNLSSMFPYLGSNDGQYPRFMWTFRGCTGLTSIPAGLFSGITTGSTYMFYQTFYGCTGLTSVPAGLFSGITTGAMYMFYGTFYGCTGLTAIPAGLFSGITTSAYGMFYQTFYGCTNLTSIPAGLFSGITTGAEYLFYQTFYGCTNLTSIPAGLFSGITTSASNMFNGTFKGCTLLTSIPAGLFSGITTGAESMFSGTFSDCTNLSGYISPTTFAGLIANNHPTATNMWSDTFTNTDVATSCEPYGTTQYITGYESEWNGKVSCGGEYAVTYSCGDGTGTPPSTTGVSAGLPFIPALNTCKKTDLVFAGWGVSDTNDVVSDTFTWNYNENKTLTAQWREAKFKVTTTNLNANDTFTWTMSAKGTFTVVCGADGVLTSSANDVTNGDTITRTGTSYATYTCTYTTGGVKTILFDGSATGYNTTINSISSYGYQYAPIAFRNNTKVASIYGNLPSVFQYKDSHESVCPRFIQTFSGCTSLTSIPAGLFSGITTGADVMFYGTFSGCTGLTSVPAGLFSGITKGTESMFSGTFSGCTGLTSIPSGLFSGITTGAGWLFNGTFSGCTGLTSIPSGLFANITTGAENLFQSTFDGCTNLSGYIPPTTFAGLIANNHPIASQMWYQTFNNTQVATSCASYPGTTQYITGYEGSGTTTWNGKVSCIETTPREMTLNTTGADTGATPSTVYLSYNTGWYSDVAGTTPITSLTTLPTKSGLVFAGFYTGESGTGTQIIAPNGDFVDTKLTIDKTTLYAHFANGYNITYVMDGGTNYSGAPTAYPEGVGTTIDGTPTKSGYAFAGWCTDSTLETCALTQTITINDYGDKTFYAKWTQCDACDATHASCELSVVNNVCTYTTSCNTGYSNIQNSGEYNASCSANTYNITYVMNDGTNYENAPTTYTYGTGTTIDGTPTKDGYTFAGWCTDSTLETCAMTQTIANDATGDKTFYAKWREFKFKVTTTNLEASDTFTWTMSATGTFTVDCGADGTLSSNANDVTNGNTITRTGTTYATYTCTYSTGGVKTISFDGEATGYSSATPSSNYYQYAPIAFYQNAKLSSLSGDLSTIFPDLGSNDGQYPRFMETFSGCAGLTSVPATLFNDYTTGKTRMFYSTFTGCTSLTSIPAGLFSGITAGGLYVFQSTFSGCTGLTSIPAGLFSSITKGKVGLFHSTFYGCTGLTSIPAELFSSITTSANVTFTSDSEMFTNTFRNCTGLTSIPAGLFSGVTPGANNLFESTFMGCTSLTSIPSGLFSGITMNADYMFWNTFHSCTSLSTIPANLFSGITKGAPSMFYSTFGGCTGLTAIPAGLFSGITTSATQMFYSTFGGCTSLSGYIPPTTFAGLIAKGHPTANNMWVNTFYNTQVATSCNDYLGTTQYITGYEGTGGVTDWGGKVSCITTTPQKITLNEGADATAASPSSIYLSYNTDWYSDAAGTTPITSLTTLPTKSGLVFVGFYTGENGTGTQIIDKDGDILPNKLKFTIEPTTLYAHFANGYTVTYSCGDGTGTAPTSERAISGIQFTPSGVGDCAKEGYVFGGWAVSNTNDVIGTAPFTWNYTENKTLTAQWFEPKFTVTTTNLNANNMFQFTMSAKGTFTVNCGADGTLSSSTNDVSGNTITRSNTTYAMYTCTYSTSGVKTISFDGTATGYNSSTSSSNRYRYAPIAFYQNTKLLSISGDLSSLFPELGSGLSNIPRFMYTFYGCTSLTSIPAGLFSGITTGSTYMFYYTFYGCTNLSGYIPPTTFAGLIANDSPTANYMWQETFNNTNVAISCTSYPGTTQYITGYEGSGNTTWNSKVSCIETTPREMTLNAGPGATATTPSTVYLSYNTGWYSDSAGTTPITSLTTLPTKSGLVFAGFYTGENGTGTQMIAPNGDFVDTKLTIDKTTLYAHFANGYNITYVMDGGTNYSGAPTAYPEGVGTTIDGTPTKAGYTFAGWCTDSTLETCAMTQTIGTSDTGDKTFYAKWTQCDACAATNATCELSVVNNVCTYTTACNTGYGNIQNNGAYNASCSANTYNISYEMDSGTNYNNAPTTYTYATGATIDGKPSKAGYFFDGWCTDSGLTTCAATQTIDTNATGDKTFYAKWTQAKFSVTTTNLSAGNTFQFTMSATGTFTVDCGEGGTLTSSANDVTNGNTITRSNTTYATYTCTYSTGGVKTILFDGTATGYYPNPNDGGYQWNWDDYGKSTLAFQNNTKVASVSGSLTDLFPQLGTESLAQIPRFNNTFYGCSNLTTIPANLFSGLTVGGDLMFSNTFYGCSSLQEIPAGLFSSVRTITLGMFCRTFQGCTSLQSIPQGLFDNMTTTGSIWYLFQSTFEGCTGIRSIPDRLFGNISSTDPYMFQRTFYGCTNLSGYIPPTAFAGLIANDSPTATDMWDNTFTGTNVATSCASYTGTTQYITGYEGATNGSTWNGKVSCGEYAVTYDCGTGTGTPPATTGAGADAPFKPAANTCTKDGYTFNGWAVSDTQDVKPAGTFFTWEYTGDKTLTAQFDQCTPCDATNASCELSVENNVCTYTTTCDTGYENIQNNGEYNASCSAKTYTVSYACGTGATGDAPADGTATYDASFTPAANTCTKTGYVFTGWGVDGTNDVKSAGTAFTWNYDSDKTLTAKWARFAVTTTNLNANDTFTFTMSATGTFYVDCGADGTLSSSANDVTNGNTITRSTTTYATYTCTYSTGGVKTILFDGTATGYNDFGGPYSEHAAIAFYNNTKLSSISGDLSSLFPQLGSGLSNLPRFMYTFNGCTNLTSIPAGLFSGITTGAENMFYTTFYGCTGLTSIPAGLFSGITTGAVGMFYYTFAGCTGLTSIPAGLFSGITTDAVGMFCGTFSDCTGLTSIPAGLFSGITTSADYMFYYTFYNCTGLTSIPAELFSGITTGADYMFADTFNGCTGLTSIPAELFSGITTGADYMFADTFNGCTNLSGYIPPTAFAGLIANDSPTATGMWDSTFTNTNVATSCASYPDTTQYITGYESEWNGKVSCIETTPMAITLDSGEDADTPAVPSTVYLSYDTGIYSDSQGNDTISQLTASPTKSLTVFDGFYTNANGTGTKVIDANGGVVPNTLRFASTPKTLYANWTECAPCDANSSGCELTVVNNTCTYTYTCNNGYYLPANAIACALCPANNYCPTGTYEQDSTDQGKTACSTGLFSPAGMWSESQCGHILHIGEDKVYSRSSKQTTPSLNIDIDNDGEPDFFVNMTATDIKMNTDTDKKLKINYNDTTYSVYDDSVLDLVSQP